MLSFRHGDALKLFFSFFDGNDTDLLHTLNTSHYKLFLGTSDRSIITVIAALFRHSGSVYFGLDQIIILRTTKQLFSSLYEPIYTIHT